MPVPVIMPKLEMSQETAIVVDWLKREGDSVKKGEPIMTIETDKVTVEVESTGDGILRDISAKVGDIVPVTTVIAYLYQPDEKPVRPGVPPAPVPAAAVPLSTTVPFVTPVAANIAAAEEVDLSLVKGSGPAGRIIKSDVTAALKSKQRASPAARRIARQQAIPLAEIDGTGPRGRIQTTDVIKFLKHAPASVSLPFGAPEVIPLSSMRRTIAERMLASTQTIPQISFTARVDTTVLDQLRTRLNERSERLNGPHVSLTSLFIKIVAHTLRRHRWLNSSLRENEILLFPYINIGMAVALSDGLIVPVIQNADQKGIETLAEEVIDLTQKARQNKLQPAEVTNSTFTISNLGPFGIEQFNAIINPGQAAILAISAAQAEVVPVDGRPEIRPILRMTLSVDHRIVDGAVAAHFIMDLKSAMEFPGLVLW